MCLLVVYKGQLCLLGTQTQTVCYLLLYSDSVFVVNDITVSCRIGAHD